MRRVFIGVVLSAWSCTREPLPVAPAQDLAGAADLAVARDLAPPPDLAPPARDLALPPDLMPAVGTVCGAAVCAASIQFCDSADEGITGTCRANVAPEHAPYACDGPEDCPSRVCCMTPDGSACSTLGFCVAGNVKGLWMCHDTASCGVGFRCCPVSPTSPYSVCRDGACP